MDEDIVQHFSHPHALRPEISTGVFICVGCKEKGWGHRYSCEDCKYTLHKNCVLAPPQIKHPFLGKSIFNFCHHKLTDDACCFACDKVLLGYTYAYRNGKKTVHLHPGCAQLPFRLEDEEYELRERISSMCGRCGRKDDGWAYRNKKRDYHFHVSCLFEMAIVKHEKERLKEIGGDKLLDKVSMTPSLQLTNYHGKQTKVEKMRQVGKVVRNLFITSVTGDPTGGAMLMHSVSDRHL